MISILNQLRPLINCLVWIVFCHVTGNYIFKPALKTESKWNLFVRGICYCLPYLICFGIRWQLAFIFALELVVESSSGLNVFWKHYIRLVGALVYILPIFTGVRTNLGPVTMWLALEKCT